MSIISWTFFLTVPSSCSYILDLQLYWSIFNILIRLAISFTSTNTKACAVAVDGPFILIKSTTDPDLCSKLVHVAELVH